MCYVKEILKNNFDKCQNRSHSASFQTLAGAILFGARYVPMSSFGLLLRGWDSAVDVRALSRAVGMTSEME